MLGDKNLPSLPDFVGVGWHDSKPIFLSHLGQLVRPFFKRDFVRVVATLVEAARPAAMFADND